jgi:nucleotide-binding universal stress UspA family protein
MKVLIAVDGSSGGFEAVRQAGQLLEPGRDQVAFYYSPPGLKPDGGHAEPQILERARGFLGEAIFNEARQLLPQGLQANVEQIIDVQPPKHGIVTQAELWRADLIAMGARGLGPIERLLLGSVSSSVIQAARIPVLIARPRPADRKQDPLRVLLAFESTPEDGYLADVVKVFKWPPATQGYTISAVQSMFAGHVPKWLEERARSEEVDEMARVWVAEHEAEIKAKHAEIAAFDATLPEPFHAAEPIVIEGHPADKILATIHDRKIDLVILGARTPASVSKFLLGSTSQTILSHAPCSVLIVRQKSK